jgi:hypothetical protein
MQLLLVLAMGLSPVGVVMCWVGVRTLREQWVLRRRGIRVPAIAERWESRIGSFGVYRFLDTGGRTRFANAERVRTIPAAEVTIAYDPANITMARERFRLAETIIAVVCLLVGSVVTVAGLATLVLAIIVFA